MRSLDNLMDNSNFFIDSQNPYDMEILSIIENSYNYRWHDLRKNPSDLPNDSFRHVLVKVVHRYSDSDGYYDYDMGFIHSDGIEKRWGFKSSKNEEIYKVIAWSEINPFEEES